MFLHMVFVLEAAVWVFAAEIRRPLDPFPSLAESILLSRGKREDSDNDYVKACCNFQLKSNADDKFLVECASEMKTKYGLVLAKNEGTEPPPTDENDDSPFSADDLNVYKNLSVCLPQCLLQKFKAVDTDGKLIPEEAIKYMKSIISMTEEKLWAAVKKTCAKAIPSEGTYVCSPEAANFRDCVFFMTDLHCPEDKQRKGTRCDGYRKDLKARYESKE